MSLTAGNGPVFDADTTLRVNIEVEIHLMGAYRVWTDDGVNWLALDTPNSQPRPMRDYLNVAANTQMAWNKLQAEGVTIAVSQGGGQYTCTAQRTVTGRRGHSQTVTVGTGQDTVREMAILIALLYAIGSPLAGQL